uniref:Phosphatidylinositol glycan anchor biosynthesis class F n=1 Tax=Equus asinus TaxID=9793 RepID=A0A9L0JF68_EQUAS
MKDTDIKRLLYTHLLCICSIILSIFIPSFFLENFSILETHLTWLCICSVSVTAVNLVLYLVVKPNASSKRSSLSFKVTRFVKCCVYFLMSCFTFHVIFVLYGAPLIELVLETFLFAVTLSTFTTVPCLCLLGPNIKAWLRVFSRNGRKISPELTAANPPLFAEEDWPRANIHAHLPLLYTWDAYHSMACQVVLCPHPVSKPRTPGCRSGTCELNCCAMGPARFIRSFMPLFECLSQNLITFNELKN